jgi:hypothetical protein
MANKDSAAKGDTEVQRSATETAIALVTDPVRAVMQVSYQAAQQAEKSASLFLIGFGVTLMLLAVLTRIGFGDDTLATLTTGEFLALLFSGLLVLLIGAGYRMYSSWIVDSAEREKAKWIRERAGVEADAGLERARAYQAAALEPDEPPNGKPSDRING